MIDFEWSLSVVSCKFHAISTNEQFNLLFTKCTFLYKIVFPSHGTLKSRKSLFLFGKNISRIHFTSQLSDVVLEVLSFQMSHLGSNVEIIDLEWPLSVILCKFFEKFYQQMGNLVSIFTKTHIFV